jgi:hypothetical protein
MSVLASIIAACVAALAFMAGATGRAIVLVVLVLLLWIAPRVAPLASSFGKTRRSVFAVVVVAVAIRFVFWPTPLFILDVMTAVPPTAGDSSAAPTGGIVAIAPNVGINARRQADDHVVYSTVLREHFMRPERGEHGLLCQPDSGPRTLAIVGTTQRVPPGTPARDSGWAAELPTPARSLMFALRALDSEPSRALQRDSINAGVPVDLVSDSAARRMVRLGARRNPSPDAPPLFWFSRVTYTPDGTWALVYAVEMCPGITEAQAADAENGAYERVLLAPLEWRNGAWAAHPPIFLDVGLPRLEPR